MSRKKKNKPKRKPTAPPRLFPNGSRVRVRPGILDPDFPDIPLGGWAGAIIDADDSSDQGWLVLVEWDKATLDQIHPVYRQRCERNGLDLEQSWLYESELELAIGDPVPIEQPGTLMPRPLDPGDQDDRLRILFGRTSDEPLPPPNREWLTTYHRYLSEHLPLPLDAIYDSAISFTPGKEEAVRLVGLAPLHQVNEEDGLLGEIVRNGKNEMVQLINVETTRNNYAHQLIGDYSYWFCEADTYEIDERPRIEIRRIDHDSEEESPGRSFASLLFRSALLGTVCGAMVGAITASVPGAAFALFVAAGVFTAAGYFLGSRLGFLLRALQLAEKAPLVGSIFGAFAGAVLGAMVGPMVVAFPGTVLGSIAGFIVGRTLALCGVKQPGGILGGVMGTGLGGVAYACALDSEKATTGLIAGGVLGAVIGVVMVLMFFASLLMFESRRKE